MENQINQTNFYEYTIAEFNFLEDKEYPRFILNDPDYISDSGSIYWFNDEGVYRLSNHWMQVGSCFWKINCKVPTNGLSVLGFCKWTDFHKLTNEFLKANPNFF